MTSSVRKETGLFVGRDEDLERLARSVTEVDRLVTVIGPAGVGKTRLVHEWIKRAALGPKIVFCDLSSVTADRVSSALAASLGLDGHHPRGLAQLPHALAQLGPMIIIMDNAEQVCVPVRKLVRECLAHSASLRFVITSREPLGLADEARLMLAPLAQAHALALFTALAHGHKGGDEDIIREVVRRLEGLPLAIELAASHLDVVTPRELLARIASEIVSMAAPRSSRSERHSTIFLALESSWRDLGEDDRRVLIACSVFCGGFTLAMAERVAGLAREAVVHCLASLVRRSLLRRLPDETPDAARFDFFMIIREFARVQLQRSPGAQKVRERHCVALVELFEAHRDAYFHLRSDAGEKALRRERDNLLGAEEYLRAQPCRQPKDRLRLARLALACDAVLRQVGPYARQERVLSEALAKSKVLPTREGKDLHLALLLAQARALHSIGQLATAESIARRAVNLAGRSVLAARAHETLAYALMDQLDHTAAKKSYERGLLLARRAKDQVTAAMCQAHLGIIAMNGDALDDAVRVAQGLEQARPLTYALLCRGLFFLHRAAYSQALIDLDTAQNYAEKRNLPGLLVGILFFAGAAHWLCGDSRRAETIFQRAILMQTTAAAQHLHIVTLCAWAALLLQNDRFVEARARIDQALVLAVKHKLPMLEAVAWLHQAALAAQCDQTRNAEQALSRAQAIARRSPAGWLVDMLDVARGFLLLAKARADQGSIAGVQQIAEHYLTRDDPSPRLELLWLRRGLQQALEAHSKTPRKLRSPTSDMALVVHATSDWSSVRLPNGQHLDLRRRKVSRAILGALAASHRALAGQALSTETLVARIWPGERLLPGSASNRLYNAIALLRQLGFGQVIVKNADGYLFAPQLDLRELR